MNTTKLFECLGLFTQEIHTILSGGGRKALEEEFAKKAYKRQGALLPNLQVMNKWDDVLNNLKNVSEQLKKGEKSSIIEALRKLSNSVTSLQLFIVNAFVEIGSFVPGPVGIVCGVVLAIGCFASGNIPGGFLNLLCAIPFVKCAKFLPKTRLELIISKSGLSNFKPIGFERYMNALSFKISQFRYTNNLSRMLEEAIQKAQRTTGNIVEGVEKMANKQGLGFSVGHGIQGKLDDLDLLGEKGFLNRPDVLEAQSERVFSYIFIR